MTDHINDPQTTLYRRPIVARSKATDSTACTRAGAFASWVLALFIAGVAGLLLVAMGRWALGV